MRLAVSRRARLSLQSLFPNALNTEFPVKISTRTSLWPGCGQGSCARALQERLLSHYRDSCGQSRMQTATTGDKRREADRAGVSTNIALSQSGILTEFQLEGLIEGTIGRRPCGLIRFSSLHLPSFARVPGHLSELLPFRRVLPDSGRRCPDRGGFPLLHPPSAKWLPHVG